MRITEGVARFQDKVFPEHRALFERLAAQQEPETLLIACSDSRVVPALFLQSQPGEVFVCRNAGNIVPAYGGPSGGVSATIEFAVVALNVKHIVVCGHSDCGAMKGLMHPETLTAMPSVAAWLRHADRAAAVVREARGELTKQEALDALTEENVLTQLDNLITHPSVAARLRRGALELHGWIYDIKEGRFRALDPAQQAFVPLELPASDVRSDVEVPRGAR